MVTRGLVGGPPIEVLRRLPKWFFAVESDSTVDQPVELKERYVTRAELAHMMGVSVRSVDRLRAMGMPSSTWGIRSRRFLASEAISWAKSRGAEFL